MREGAPGLLELCLGARPRVLGPLALGQIEHERHALPDLIPEIRGAQEDGHAAAVLAEVLLLEWLKHSERLELWHMHSPVALQPFRWRQVRPTEAARDQIIAVVFHDPEKRVIGLGDPSVEVIDEDADDVGLKQPTNLRFALLQLVKQPRFFERHRRPARPARSRPPCEPG